MTDKTLERGAKASAEGIAISGDKDRGGIETAVMWAVELVPVIYCIRRIKGAAQCLI